MSSVPGNQPLDFAGVEWDDPFSTVQTQSTDIGTSPLSSGIPDNYVDTPRSAGITFNGILNKFNASTDSLLNTFGKIYSLDSKVENAKFQRSIQSATLDLTRARALGALDVQRATLDADIAIEKQRAARGTGDAAERKKSGEAGYFVTKIKKSPVIILGVLVFGFAAYKLSMK